MRSTSEFETSANYQSAAQNIFWGRRQFSRRSRLIARSATNDCWTGDAQFFSRTACLHRTWAGFFSFQWLKEWPSISLQPAFRGCAGRVDQSRKTSWWLRWLSDAAVIIPWNMYLTRRQRILETQYQSWQGGWNISAMRAGDDYIWDARLSFSATGWRLLPTVPITLGRRPVKT